MKKHAVYALAAYILIILGVLQVSGYILGLETIEDWGYASAASPLPIVMSEIEGTEHLTDIVKVIIKTPTQEKTIHNIQEIISNLDGPHQRKMVLFHAHLFYPLFEKHMVDPHLRFAWCNGVLSKATKTKNVQEITLDVTRKKDNYQVNIQCYNQ